MFGTTWDSWNERRKLTKGLEEKTIKVTFAMLKTLNIEVNSSISWDGWLQYGKQQLGLTPTFSHLGAQISKFIFQLKILLSRMNLSQHHSYLWQQWKAFSWLCNYCHIWWCWWCLVLKNGASWPCYFFVISFATQ